MTIVVDVLVIGAGQAGIAMGNYLTELKHSFVILEKEKRVGDSWRNRYDSLVLFTPRWFSSLPGQQISGDPDGYATKDELAEYLEKYSSAIQLPIHFNTEVKALRKSNNLFEITTNNGKYIAKKVIVATGPFQKPLIPSQLPPSIVQVHTSEYINSYQLTDGITLIVGAGNSGAQIASELSQSREVLLSVGHRMKFLPQTIAGRSLFWWFKKLGLYTISPESRIGKLIRNTGDPIIGKEVKTLIDKQLIKIKPRAVAALNGGDFI